MGHASIPPFGQSALVNVNFGHAWPCFMMGKNKVNNISSLLVSGAIWLALASGSSAATLTIGSLNLDTDDFADSAALIGFFPGSEDANDAVGAFFNGVSSSSVNISSNWPDSFLQLNFSDPIVNGNGDDLVVFDGPTVNQAMKLSLTADTSAPSIAGSFLETAFWPGQTNVNAYTFDLSDLGIGVGASVGSFFFQPASGVGNTNIVAAANLNSTVPGGGGLPPVPLPAGVWLLLTGVGALGIHSRRRKAA